MNREDGVGPFMREIFFASEEANKRSSLLGRMIADRSVEGRISCFERVENGTQRRMTSNVHPHFIASDLREVAQVIRKNHAHHHAVSVCTSTEYTAGKSRAITLQRFPLSAET